MKKIAQIGHTNVSIPCTSTSLLSKEEQLNILQELKNFLQSYNKEESYDIGYDAGYPGYFITLKQNSEMNLRGYLHIDSISSTDKDGKSINIPVVYLVAAFSSLFRGLLCYYMDGNWDFNFCIIYYDKDNYILFSEIFNDYNEGKIIREISFSIFNLKGKYFGYEGENISGTIQLVSYPSQTTDETYRVIADLDTYYKIFNGITILCPLMLQKKSKPYDNIILPYQFLSSSHMYQYHKNAFYYNESYEFFKIKTYIFYYCPTQKYQWCYLIGVQDDQRKSKSF